MNIYEVGDKVIVKRTGKLLTVVKANRLSIYYAVDLGDGVSVNFALDPRRVLPYK